MDVELPKTIHPLLLRTDFSNDSAWDALCKKVESTHLIWVGWFPLPARAMVTILDDRRLDGLAEKELLKLLPLSYNQTVLFVADAKTISHRESPILVLSLFEKPVRSIRVTPRALPTLENNLSICNMDFEDFENAVGADGIFRGFPFFEMVLPFNKRTISVSSASSVPSALNKKPSKTIRLGAPEQSAL